MRRFVKIAAGGLLALGAVPAWAADNDATSGTGIETIVVTARKTAEDAQTVPIAISAFSQADLDRLNVNTVADLQSVAPSVVIQPSTFRQDTLDITLRGQRNYDSAHGDGNPSLDFDTATAIYQDGVYYARPIGITGQIFDMDSVAVLKGPQGTLVGRNATGGAIMYTSRQPDDVFGGYVRVTGGDFAQYGLQGAINIPLDDHLSFRAAISSTGQKGYLKNFYLDPATGQTNTQAAEGTQKLAGRFQLKWSPDDSFDVLLRADLSEEHDTGISYHELGYFVGTVAASGNRPSICNIPFACAPFVDLFGHHIASYFTTVTAKGVSGVNTSPAAYNSMLSSVAREQTEGFWGIEQAADNYDVDHSATFSATVDKRFGDIDVKWLNAYRRFDSTGNADSRGQPEVNSIYTYNIPKYRAYQSELSAAGAALDDRLKWTAGLFFFEETDPTDGNSQALYSTSNNGAPQAATGKQITITDASRNGEMNISYAGYLQATYEVLPGTRLTGGVRYTVDQRDAFLATQKILTPATLASTASVVNGVFDPAGLTVAGTTYNGQTDICALTTQAGVALPYNQCGIVVARTFHKATWTLAADHELFDRTMLYFTMRSGYRSGAINSGSFNPLVMVAKPEEVIDYETGVKSDFAVFDMPMRVNVDAYQTAYHDLQYQATLPNVTLAVGPGGGPCTQAAFNANQCLNATSTSTVTVNAARARVYGAEWDVTALPLPQLSLNAQGSYLDARYTDFAFTPPAGYLLPAGNGGNLSGTPIPAPRWQMNYTANYSFGPQQIGDFAIGDVLATAHYYWQSRYLADMRGFNPVQQTSSYGILNLRFAVEDIGGSDTDMAFFVNNVLRQEACAPEFNGVLQSIPTPTFGTPGTSGIVECLPLAPRMAGVTLRTAF
jgi:iron complex outermembrane receptor protein